MGYSIPSGNLTVRYWKWCIEIVDLPAKMMIFHMLNYQRVYDMES